MNRFRSRKKSHDGGEKQRPSNDSDVPPLPSLPSKSFKRNKKSQPETKQPEVDIATALPSSDDFRTSLLMPNLSARFSMLREQDDPTSKIGKANDDSVLFPRRASRLNLFNRNELTDIAEVDSIRSSTRPPFSSSRGESYASFDGYGTDEGSVMSRSRPGEGNTLFGGRQKIYKIHVGESGSSKNRSSNEEGGTIPSKGMGGRALYGDDVSSSAFQRLREQEKEQAGKMDSDSPSARSSKEHERPMSPLLVSYNQNRETTSSTTSLPTQSRSSTAATSVASQRSMNGTYGNAIGSPHPMPAPIQPKSNIPSVDRQPTKSRRLYGQGLDQHIYEQQSSAMYRLESIQRQRAMGGQPLPRNLSKSRSANNLQERYQRSGPLYTSNGFRAASPPRSGSPSRLAEFDLGLNEHPSGTVSQIDSGYGRSPPLSPPMSPVPDPTLVAALEPNDVGKATASGAFNKPSQQYDEHQYLQRQLQLQQGRETPPLARSFSPLALSIDEKTTSRTRDNSLASIQSRPGFAKSSQEHQSNEQPLNILPETHDPSDQSKGPSNPQDPNVEGSFLVGRSPSDLSSRAESVSEQEIYTGYPSPPKSADSSNLPYENPDSKRYGNQDHPFHHNQSQTFLASPSEAISPDNISERTITHSPEINTSSTKPKHPDLDSPTLGPNTELNGLNGLVKTHLRNDSGQSSIYPEQSPGLLSKFPMEPQHVGYPLGNEAEIRQSETFFRKSTWENEGQDDGQFKNAGLGIVEQGQPIPPPLSFRARHVLDQSTSLQDRPSPKAKQILGNDKAQRILGREAPRVSHESSNGPSWQEQLKTHHARGGSTETEKERQSFANELAERRRMVQDNLKSFVENESRSPSPMPGARTHDNSPSKPGTPFGMLKSKGSRGSLAKRPDNAPKTKAMKMLGITTIPNDDAQSGQDGFRCGDAEQSAYDASYDKRIPMQARAAPQDPRLFQNQAQISRNFEPIQSQSQEYLPRRGSPPSSKSSRDDRSNSDLSERRSDSRNGRALERDNQGDRVNGHYPEAPRFRKYSNSPRPTPELIDGTTNHQVPAERSQSAMSNRFRSNSRTNAPEYFEHRGNLPIQNSSPQLLNGLVGTPYSSRSVPSPHEPSPTLPVIATPVMMAPPHMPAPSPRFVSHRKRSINKHDISDPMFISSTSSVGTIDLPPGASLSNGMETLHPGPPPPVPPLNPRRKRTQTLLQALGRSDKMENSTPLASPIRHNRYEERSTFSADEGEPITRPRARLRKTSSEGGNLNAKARQQAMMARSPAVPSFPQNIPMASSPAMSNFPHLHHHPSPHPMPADVPASAVMF